MATHRFRIEGKEYEVQVGARTGGTVQVTVNGKAYAVEIASPGGGSAAAAAPTAPHPAPAPPVNRAATTAGSAPGEVRAPISGVVLSVKVSPGQAVATDTKVLVLEAMKMENDIFAGVDGVVASIAIQAQQEVREGDLLVVITPS